MKKKRLIPVLLLRNGWLVQSRSFSRYMNTGDPITAVKRFNDWDSDELLYLDITKDGVYDMRRDDKKHPNRNNIIDIVRDVSRYCSMPVTFGGGIRSLEDISIRISNGADKVSINTFALDNPDFITRAAKEFGSQCVVVCMDTKRIDGKDMVMTRGGKEPTPWTALAWAREAESRGAGEILIQSVDRDGAKTGYDIELIANVSDGVRIPVIALGGVGEWEHFAECLQKTNVDAVAAANIFHYVDLSMYLAKAFLYERGFNVRPPDLIKMGKEL